MGWYIFILSIIAVVALLEYSSHKQISRTALSASCIILLIFMAFRAESVGADTISYIGMFENVDYAKSVDFLRSDVYTGTFYMSVEKGYLLYNWILRRLFTAPQTITIANSVIITTILHFISKKYSPYPMLSIWLYITLGVFQTQMNMARNAIAIMICYLGVKFIKNRQLTKYILVVLFASTIHFTAIMFLPLYWLVNIKFSYKNIIRGTAVILSAGLATTVLKPFLIAIVPDRYAMYIGNETTDFSGFILGIFYFVLLLYVLYMLNKRKRLDALNKNIDGSWMAALNMSFFILGYNFAFGTRVAALFGPYLIIFIPQLIEDGIENKKKKELTVAGVYLLCGAQYVLRLMVNNIGSTMPYRFF